MTKEDLEKMLEAKIDQVTKKPEMTTGEELLQLIECARNFIKLPI